MEKLFQWNLNQNTNIVIEKHWFENVVCKKAAICCGLNVLIPLQVSLAYRQVSNISRTKSQHLKDSRTVLRLSLPNSLKPDVKSRMKM